MEFLNLFSTPVARIDATDFIATAQHWYDDVPMNLCTNGGVCKSSLVSYKPNKVAVTEDLKQRPDAQYFIKFLENNAKDFLRVQGYNIDEYDVKLMVIWVNEYTEDQYQVKHQHYGMAVSGCFYVQIPEVSAPITFYGPLNRVDKQNIEVKEYTPYNSLSWTIYPKAGDLFLWESYLFHEVPAVKSSGVRRSIAFDIQIFRKN